MSVIPAERVKLTLYEGSTLDRTFTFYTDKAKTTLRDLTGWSAKLQVRQEPDASAPVILELASAVFTPPAADGLVMGGAAGTVRAYCRDETMADLNASQFTRTTDDDGNAVYAAVWDLEMTNPAGETSRYVMGPVRFSPEVTR